MKVTAVVLAAGRGTRMRSKLPKVLHPLAGQPMIAHVVAAAWGAGVDYLVVVVGPDSEAGVRQALGDGVGYALQTPARGTGHALAQAEARLPEAEVILVLCGDTPLLTATTLKGLLEHHQSASGGRPAITMLTTTGVEPAGLGRVVRGGAGQILRVVEEAEASAEELAMAEVNTGVYAFESAWLWPNLRGLAPSPSGEIYLTDLVQRAVAEGARVASQRVAEPKEALGVNNRLQLAQAEAILRQRIRERHMLAGVTLMDPPSTFIDATVEIEPDVVIYQNTSLLGKTKIATDTTIGPHSVVVDSVIGPRCRVVASVVEGATLEEEVGVGPFSHLRPGAHLGAEVYVGNYAEVKQARLGRGTKMGHFSYVGDAELGDEVNVGAGTITCNFDGVRKNRTLVGDRVFLGSDTLLIAPVTVGEGAATGAGAVVNHDVPPNILAVGMPARHRGRRRPHEGEGQD